MKKKLLKVLLSSALAMSLICTTPMYAKAANEVQDKVEQRLNYVYVESPVLEAPMTQQIVVSWGDGSEEIEDFRIVVEREDGKVEEWESKKDDRYLHLFAKEFSDAKVETEYEITKVRFTQDGVEKEFSLDEINDVSANFGVNKEYEGFQQVDANVEEAVETSVVVLDEKGDVTSENTVEEALEESVKKLPRLARGKDKDKDGKTIVAIDAGHDAKHSGARGQGLKEEELTLKIAKYCNDELSKEKNIETYMIRETAACPYNVESNSECLELRANAAAEHDADIYVSFHLNADSDGSAASGAEVIYPNKNWKPEVGQEGEKLASSIQKELVGLGLKDRGIYDRTGGYINPDDSKADYYAVHRYNKINGVPSVIIEHAFMTNTNDANKFLKTEAGLKKLAKADAKGIVNYVNGSEGNNGSNSSKPDNTWVGYNPKRYGVTTANVNFRKGPGTSFDSITKIPTGTKILLDGYEKKPSGSWYKTTYKGKVGYVSSDYVDLDYHAYSPSKVGRTTANMYMRSGVGLNYAKKAYIKAGSQITLLGYYTTDDCDWYKIEFDGKNGYVSNKYVEVVEEKPVWVGYSPKRFGDVKVQTKMYKSSGSRDTIVATIPKGKRIKLEGYDKYKDGSFYKASFDGKVGYVSAKDVKLSYQKYEQPKTGKTTANLYMRSGVGLNYEKKAYIKAGSKVKLFGYYRTEGYDWYKIEFEGKTGYISSKYVERQ